LKATRQLWHADPHLGGPELFDPEVNEQLRLALPPECRQEYFTRATMPAHWLTAVVQNRPSYRAREKSAAINMGGLPAPMVTELAWVLERHVQLGMSIDAGLTTRLTRVIAGVLTGPRHREIVSLVQLTREEWIRAIRLARVRAGAPLGVCTVEHLDHLLGRFLGLLVHAYHRGEWWELNVWNPVYDPRIPQRLHEPAGRHSEYFGRLTAPWLREGAKWWLSRQLEAEVYTWSTVNSRLDALKWFQRYLDAAGGCDGPHLVDDERRLRGFIEGFQGFLARQRVTTGPTKGQQLSTVVRRAAMTSLEQFYRFCYENQDEAAGVLGEQRWRLLRPQHAVLFRFGDKPKMRREPPPDAVLSDEVLSRLASQSELLALPASEGGFGDEQALRALAILMRTGRRINEVLMLDFDPLHPVVSPGPDGGVARLRYQQTKILTSDPTIVIDQELVAVIRAQQDWARARMAELGSAGLTPKYLFLAVTSNRNGQRPYPMATLHYRLAALAERIDLRNELGQRVRLSRTHNFRHSKATGLINAGVPLHVVMRYMGHLSPAMTMHYAQTLSQTHEREFLRFKKITADGREYEGDPQDLFDRLQLDRRTDRILPNGWCLLPPRQACTKGNACLSCTKFVTDETFRPSLHHQLAETGQLITRRQAEHQQRYGHPMTSDNVWLTGRQQETAALEQILITLDRVRTADGTVVPIRGAGSAQRPLTSPAGEDTQ
jgi:integrase